MITREELYHMVWTRPARDVARRLGISDVYLVNVCKALNVPKPPRGWWSSNDVGRTRPALPATQRGRPVSWSKGGVATSPIKHFYASPSAGPMVRGMHPLAVCAIEYFRGVDAKGDGAILAPRAHRAADLTISQGVIDAAIEAFNTLSIALEDRSHIVSIERWQNYIRPSIDFRDPSSAKREDKLLPNWTPRWPTIAKINGTALGLAIVEIREIREMEYAGDGRYIPVSTKRRAPRPSAGITWRERRWMPSGRLKLVAYSPFHRFPWKAEWALADPDDVATMSALVHRLEDAAARLQIRRNE
ncbi:hypothetical protein [Pararhizobium sp. PWRC1-1]|uniref:hypothetical protein n=1 Tax=Pararhizobium sp. PWRC1-1 TaxID=2804566 RepID=UPI003CEFB4DB